jgi:ribonuclease D
MPDKVTDPEAYLRLKGAKDLDRRGLAILRELHAAREALALRLDRPPFMILGNESLVGLAAKRPHSNEDILAVPGCTVNVLRRSGPPILEAVARGEAVPEDALPVRQPAPRPNVPAAVRRRAEALRAWRGLAAKELGLDPGVLFPQRLIDRLAAEPPAGRRALEQVEGVRRWRVELFGDALLKALAAA